MSLEVFEAAEVALAMRARPGLLPPASRRALQSLVEGELVL